MITELGNGQDLNSHDLALKTTFLSASVVLLLMKQSYFRGSKDQSSLWLLSVVETSSMLMLIHWV